MDYKSPWWVTYRKKRYKPKNYLTMEMILRKSFVETVREYLACSSMAGIKEISNPERTLLQRILRAALCFSSLVVVIYFLHYTWVSTLAKPLVVTGDSSTYPIHDIDFPAVALCNINRISRKALRNCTETTYPKLAKFNITLTHLESFYQDMGRLIDFDYDDTRRHVQLMEIFAMKEYSDLTVNIMKTLAPSCKEMLVKCLWAGKEVDCNSIFELRRTVLGHCCAFNYVLDYNSAVSLHGTIAPIKRQIVPGVDNGLRVVIDPMLDDYAYPLTFRTGFEVLIFDPIHFADSTGGRVLQRMVQPNQEHFFQIESMKQVAAPEVRKYPVSARKCLFRDENSIEFNNKYSYSACLVKCRIQSVKSLCKCIPYFLPSSDSTSPTCTLKNLRCLDKYREKLKYLFPIDTEDTEGLEQELADSLFCPNCQPDCELTQHFTKSFDIPLPVAEGSEENKGFVGEFLYGVNLTNKSVISIYHPTTGGVIHRLDVVAYWFEILSNIGGFSGMLMGIGIYTFVELTYFLLIRFVQISYANYMKYN